jgi:uncharacterized protein YdhG (YjbR/CyaY superfamily)
MAKSSNSSLRVKTPDKSAKKNVDENDAVENYMRDLKHPLKDAIELTRKIIKSADKNISERIKWNAPSYYYQKDLVTFNPRNQKLVHLVFHHPFIVKIKSGLLLGDYKDRRMVYFKDPENILANKKELKRIMAELVKGIDT